ncbi:MAG: hypothetical protein GF384_05090, partial [Elusimicrobia bacterium]|nr:hypothetical protein [Elusimicrobiota bacterium]MBD3412166.1 hypothetical protein [Elusimicrobiota bacterium]
RMIIKIKETIIEVLKGDLIQIQADVYVCPININLCLQYGIAQVLAKHGGDEYVAQIQAKEPNQELGTVITTRAGNLKAKYIFHAVLEDAEHEVPRDNIEKVLYHCFRLMEAMNLHTIVCPMLGSPRSKVPYDTFSRLMTKATFAYFTGNTNYSMNVKFVLYNEELYKSFCDQLNIIRQEYFI